MINFQIYQCRKQLYNMTHVPYSDEQDPPQKPHNWKRACAAVLTQKVPCLCLSPCAFLERLTSSVKHWTV